VSVNELRPLQAVV